MCAPASVLSMRLTRPAALYVKVVTVCFSVRRRSRPCASHSMRSVAVAAPSTIKFRATSPDVKPRDVGGKCGPSRTSTTTPVVEVSLTVFGDVTPWTTLMTRVPLGSGASASFAEDVVESNDLVVERTHPLSSRCLAFS